MNDFLLFNTISSSLTAILDSWEEVGFFSGRKHKKNKTPKRWYRRAPIVFSLLFIAIMCFTLLPSPVQIGPLSFGGAGVARADSSTIYPNKDSYMLSNAATTNYGNAISLSVLKRVTGGNLWSHPIINADLSGIPAGATIDAATLYLYYLGYAFGNPNTLQIDAYECTRKNWVEGNGGAGSGVTWNTYDGSNTWTAAGGDYGGTPASTTFPASAGWMSWNVLAIASDAFGNHSGSLDLILRFTTETGAINDGSFYSSDYTTDTSKCPYLTVTYTLAPTVATLAATSITSTSATLNGNVTSLGTYGNVTSYGFVLSTTTVANSPGNVSPSAQTTYTAGNWTWSGVQYAAGTTFTSNGNVTGLSSPNTYYFRAAGYSTYGWAYGEEASFSIGILSIQPPTDDARVNIDAPTTNYGNDDLMCLRPGNGIINTQRSLVSFSTSSIPDGVTIISATLSVYLVSYYLVDLSGLHVLCQRTTSAWSEGTVTWNTQPTATATNQAETTLPNDPAWMEFTGAQVLALAQYAVANGDVFSALIRLETESGSDSMPTFATSEYATENLRPKLVVTYEYTPGVSNTPADKGLGIVLPNTYYWGKSGTQVGPSSWPLEDTDSIGNITNPTGFAINVLFSMSSMAGGITWNPGTTPGANVFVVKVGMSGVTNEAGMTKLSTTPQKLITNLPGGDHIHWEFVFYTPTNLITNNDSTEHTGYLTVAAEAY